MRLLALLYSEGKGTYSNVRPSFALSSRNLNELIESARALYLFFC